MSAKAKQRPLRPRTIGWLPQAQLIKLFLVKERKLAVMASLKDPTDPNGPWQALAIETTGSSVTALLAQHGHKDLGEHPTMAAAVCVGELYGDEWAAGAVIEACSCSDIVTDADVAEFERDALEQLD